MFCSNDCFSAECAVYSLEGIVCSGEFRIHNSKVLGSSPPHMRSNVKAQSGGENYHRTINGGEDVLILNQASDTLTTASGVVKGRSDQRFIGLRYFPRPRNLA